MEVCLNEDGNLHVLWYRVSVQMLVLRVINVIDLNLVLREARTIDADFDYHGILADVHTVSVFDDGLGVTHCGHRVLIHELCSLSARTLL